MTNKALMSARMNKRVEIRQGEQTPNSAGGFTRTYKVLANVWAELKPINYRFSGAEYVRDRQITDLPTHEFRIRQNSAHGVITMGDEAYVRSDYFIYVPTTTEDGRLFRIQRVTDPDERGVEYKILAREMERQSSKVHTS